MVCQAGDGDPAKINGHGSYKEKKCLPSGQAEGRLAPGQVSLSQERFGEEKVKTTARAL